MERSRGVNVEIDVNELCVSIDNAYDYLEKLIKRNITKYVELVFTNVILKPRVISLIIFLAILFSRLNQVIQGRHVEVFVLDISMVLISLFLLTTYMETFRESNILPGHGNRGLGSILWDTGDLGGLKLLFQDIWRLIKLRKIYKKILRRCFEK